MSTGLRRAWRAAAGRRIGGLAALAERLRAVPGGPPRLLVAKPGLDGHSNGAEQVAVAARDAGMEVIYQGIRLTPEQIAAAARDEDVDVIGLSILSGSHLELVPEVIRLLRAEGVTAPVVVGGIIPEEDRRQAHRGGRRRRVHPEGLRAGTHHGRHRHADAAAARRHRLKSGSASSHPAAVVVAPAAGAAVVVAPAAGAAVVVAPGGGAAPAEVVVVGGGILMRWPSTILSGSAISLKATSDATVTPNIWAIFDSESPDCTMYSCGTVVDVGAGAVVLVGNVGRGVVVVSDFLSSSPMTPHAGATTAMVATSTSAAADRRRLNNMLTTRSSLPLRPASERRRRRVAAVLSCPLISEAHAVCTYRDLPGSQAP